MENKRNKNKIEHLSSPEVVSMADAWYEFATESHFWIKARFAALLKVPEIKNIRNSTLLEIGCGNGMVIKQLETLPGVVVDGCDLNSFALQNISEIKGSLYCLNIFDKPKFMMQKYDGIVLMDIIEHIEDDSSFLNASLPYLKSGGFIIINVPASSWLFSDYDIMAGHKRRYSKKNLYELFRKNNITPISVSYWGFSFVPIAILRKLLLVFSEKKNIIRNGFKPPNEIINNILGKVSTYENRMIKSPIFGTSVIAVGKYRPD